MTDKLLCLFVGRLAMIPSGLGQIRREGGLFHTTPHGICEHHFDLQGMTGPQRSVGVNASSFDRGRFECGSICAALFCVDWFVD